MAGVDFERYSGIITIFLLADHRSPMVIPEVAAVILVAGGLDDPIPAGPPPVTPDVPVNGAGTLLPPAAPVI